MKAIETQKCPKCQNLMKERKGRYGKFYGCTKYPKCRGTRPWKEAKKKAKTINELFEGFVWSDYQMAIYEKFGENGKSSFGVKAVAGSGKTTLLQYLAYLLPKDKDIIYTVFNTDLKNEAQEKFPEHVPAVTTHSLGRSGIVDFTNRSPKLKTNKVYLILRNLLDWDMERWMRAPVTNIVGKVKNTLVEPTSENIAWIVDRWGIQTNGSFNRIVQLVQQVMQQNDKDLQTVDFDDMLYLPHRHNMPLQKYDIILADEVQDFNRAQIQLILNSLKEGGKALVVGDESQSMYGFRGADTEAMPNVLRALDAETLPLSITYRCPKSHVRLVNALFPEIPFEAAPDAKEGSVESVNFDGFLATAREGDMVLCRTNAPLVAPCFQMIRSGKKAIIRGRDIGKGLVTFIKKFDTNDIGDLFYQMREYRDTEMVKLLQAEKNTSAQILDDKVQTVIAVSENCETVSDIISKIEDIFTDKREGVVFSTVHKAKGLEATNVFILKSELMPHPMATKDWQILQERHIKYVAFTRAKARLVFVDASVPFVGDAMWTEEVVERGQPVISDNGQESLTELVKAKETEVEVPAISDCPF